MSARKHHELQRAVAHHAVSFNMELWLNKLGVMILASMPRGKRRDTVGAFRPPIFLNPFPPAYIRSHHECTRGEFNTPIVTQ
jgi:hypothetical protein